jgi:hypothetical protein
MNAIAADRVTPYHKGIKEIPSQEYLRACFDYVDGRLVWKRRPVEHFVTQDACTKWGNKMAGKKAGYLHSSGKYVKITIGGGDFAAGRVIWTWHNGNIDPGLEIDHIDGDGLNNRIENLRLVSMSQNAANRIGWLKKKTNLPKGVTIDGNLFRVRVVFEKKIRFSAWFKTAEEAAEAYKNKAKEIHGEYSRKTGPTLEDGASV